MNQAPTRMRLLWTCSTLACAIPLLTGCNPEPGGHTAQPGGPVTVAPVQEPPPPAPQSVWPPRAIWVVRHAYKSPDEIASVMEQAREAGLNTVLWQVRGNGTVYYRSSIEPLAYEFNGDPGFDPLEVACREAHRRGLALHAWVNVMPAWRGQTPPSDPRQLYNTRPDWFLQDQKGKRQPLGWYVSLNPALPQVREYLVGLLQEIVRKYPVDGLHLDYIRYPTDESPRGSDYPHDAQTLAIYKRETGKRPQDDAAHWRNWRTYQVSRLVWEIRTMMLKTRPQAKLTAACGADFNDWKRSYFQDGPSWLRGKLVDLVFVMNYSENTNTYRQRQEAWQRASGGRPTAPGIGVYLHNDDRITVEQLRLAQRWNQGFGLFSASTLLANSARAQQRMAAIRPVLQSMQRRPVALGPAMPEDGREPDLADAWPLY